MKKIIYTIIIIAFGSLLVSCASSNVKRFNPDPLHKANIEKHITQKTSVRVIMPKGDKKDFSCRGSINIYMPNKMTYSQYIEDAFKKSLLLANKLSDTTSSSNSLLVILTKIDFSSIGGKWYIEADVVVNNNAPVSIKSITEFAASYEAILACSNITNVFDEAVGDFVNQVFSNQSIKGYFK